MGFSVNIATNVAPEQKVKKQAEVVSRPIETAPKVQTLNDRFIKEKKKNGLIERVYDGFKNLTGLGTGSKKVKAIIAKAEAGEITDEEAKNTIKAYKKSQETSAQTFGDFISVGTSGLAFWGITKNAKDIQYKIKAGAIGKEGSVARIRTKMVKQLLEVNPKAPVIVGIGVAALLGGITKLFTLKFNRLGSKEFKVDKNDFGDSKTRTDEQAEEYRREKVFQKAERKSTNSKNFWSGVVNGLFAPAMLLAPIVAAPLYVVGNSLNRYFIGNKGDEDKKSINNYIENLKRDWGTHATIATIIAIPAMIHSGHLKNLEKSLCKVAKNLKGKELTPVKHSNKTALDEISGMLLNSKEIRSIEYSSKPINEQIQALSKENFFTLKFKQISKDHSRLTEALRENCPPTRTIEEAQQLVNKTYDGYTLTKLLGVGTVAETYLAKGKNGKEVCIKLLKEGITAEKIAADKAKTADMIKNLKDKSSDEIEYLLKNLDDLADGVMKEIDLKNEMEAAQKLVNSTKVAKVVKPIEVKDNIYVMERAEGISLSSLMKLNQKRIEKEVIEKQLKKGKDEISEKTLKQNLEKVNAEIEQIQSRTPDYGDININDEDVKYLLDKYVNVLVEQFNKIERNGKVIHADIHPGNIFIDVKALRARKGKLFTLIDTGNVIEQTREQAIRAINLTSYLNKGNVPALSEYILEGAKLPKGMKKEQALEKIKNELNAVFFDDKTAIEEMNTDNFLKLAEGILQKYDIIPGRTQLNLNKANQSSINSLKAILEGYLEIKGKEFLLTNNVIKKIGTLGETGIEWAKYEARYSSLKALQEKLNLLKMNWQQFKTQLKDPNQLKSTDEKLLTYKFKQQMPIKKEETSQFDFLDDIFS